MAAPPPWHARSATPASNRRAPCATASSLRVDLDLDVARAEREDDLEVAAAEAQIERDVRRPREDLPARHLFVELDGPGRRVERLRELTDLIEDRDARVVVEVVLREKRERRAEDGGAGHDRQRQRLRPFR